MTTEEHIDLARFLDKPVIVHLKNGKEFTGIFTGYDDYINVVLSDAQEVGGKTSHRFLIFKGGLVGAVTLQ